LYYGKYILLGEIDEVTVPEKTVPDYGPYDAAGSAAILSGRAS
jgi:hypothetical protein